MIRDKVYAAYKAAVEHKGQPTVILAKTVKGYGMGESGEGQMIAHQAKKMNEDALRQFRDRFQIPVSDEQFEGRAVPALRRGYAGNEISRASAARRSAAICRPGDGKSEPLRDPAACRPSTRC